MPDCYDKSRDFYQPYLQSSSRSSLHRFTQRIDTFQYYTPSQFFLPSSHHHIAIHHHHILVISRLAELDTSRDTLNLLTNVGHRWAGHGRVRAESHSPSPPLKIFLGSDSPMSRKSHTDHGIIVIVIVIVNTEKKRT